VPAGGSSGGDSKKKVAAHIKLLTIQDAPGFEVRGLTLDGDAQTEALVVLYGKSPGARLEQLQMRGSLGAGVLILNSEGTSESPIELSKLDIEVPAGQSGIHFDTRGNLAGAVSVNRYFRIQSCSFSGQGKRLTTTRLNAVDTDTLEKPSNLWLELEP